MKGSLDPDQVDSNPAALVLDSAQVLVCSLTVLVASDRSWDCYRGRTPLYSIAHSRGLGALYCRPGPRPTIRRRLYVGL